jgi:hypothetical protein
VGRSFSPTAKQPEKPYILKHNPKNPKPL